jgi:hypothetical protein
MIAKDMIDKDITVRAMIARDMIEKAMMLMVITAKDSTVMGMTEKAMITRVVTANISIDKEMNAQPLHLSLLLHLHPSLLLAPKLISS